MTGSPTAAEQSSRLIRWRIPPEGDPRLLRLRIAHVGLASVICALILLVAAPRETLGWGLLALVPVAVFMAFWQWRRHQRLLAGPENTWIDSAGVHWIDAANREHVLSRGEITGFRITVEEDTLRPVPSLTLQLTEHRESQPLELHPPATPAEVRRLLAGNWGLSEQAGGQESRAASYDVAIDVYSECHEEFQEWHWEGTQHALAALLDVLSETADLPLAPPGIKPPRRTVLARRREISRLAIEHDRHPRLGHDTIAGPAEMLRELAALGHKSLASAPDRAANSPPTDADLKFDLPLGREGTWTFHLHVRSVVE